MNDRQSLQSVQSSSVVEAPHPSTVVLKRAAAPDVVVEEDLYVDAVSEIIERDFFPHLKKLKLQNAFLDAVNSGDLPRAKLLGTELHRIATGYPHSNATGGTTPSASALRAETPLVTGYTPLAHKATGSETPVGPGTVPMNPKANGSAEAPSPVTGAPTLDTSLTLDNFMSKYTSEDNASFSALLKKQNEERRQKYAWYFDKEKGRLQLENGEDKDKPLQLLQSEKEVNKLLTTGDDGFAKPVETWKFKAKNTLMYDPDGAPETLADLKEIRGPPKSITHSATRFSSKSQLSGGATSQEVLAASRAAAERLHTQEVWRQMASSTPALFPKNPLNPEEKSPASFGLVPMTPSLEPHADVDPSDLMTWGMIEGTPLLLDSGGDHGGRSFSIAPTPKREAIGDRLADEAAKAMRKRAGFSTSTGKIGLGASSGVFAKPATPKNNGSLTPTLSSFSSWNQPSPRTAKGASIPTAMRAGGSAMLSPAAMKLLERSGGGIAASPMLRAALARSAAAGNHTQDRLLHQQRGNVGVTKTPSMSSSRATGLVKPLASPAPQKLDSDGSQGPKLSGGESNADRSAGSITDDLLNF